MEIPEQEKAVMRDGVHNTYGELNLLSMRLSEIEEKIVDLYQFVQRQQRLPAPAELQKHLDSMKSTIEAARDNKVEADKHLDKVRGVVDAIIKGAIG